MVKQVWIPRFVQSSLVNRHGGAHYSPVYSLIAEALAHIDGMF